MSSPIPSIEGPSGPPTSAPQAQTSASDGATFRSEFEASVRSLAGIPDAPPPAVLEEMALAGRTNEELRASGRQVRFTQDEQGGRVKIELRGSEGKMSRELSISETFDIAAGKPLR
jgi:hypothetical protein